jgi:hypothetical protein
MKFSVALIVIFVCLAQASSSEKEEVSAEDQWKEFKVRSLIYESFVILSDECFAGGI